MKIVGVPQPYAGYIITGAMDMLVMPRQVFSRCPLVIVADSRRTIRQQGTPPGLFSANIVPELCELTNVALGLVDMIGPVEPDETETGIPYMRGRCYLRVVDPRIFAEPQPYGTMAKMQGTPIDTPDLWAGVELVDRDEWRRRNPPPEPRGGATRPSADGWTGD